MKTRSNGTPQFIKILTPVIIIVAAVFIALSVVKEWVGGKDQRTGAHQSLDVRVGSQIPDYELDRFPQGKSLLSEILSPKLPNPVRVVMLNFWASWCEACISEMPSINALRASFKEKGFEVLGINLDEKPEAVVPRTIKKLKMEFPIFLDPQAKVADDFDVHAIPFTVVIDKDRKILAFQSGDADWNASSFRAKLETWLSK